MDRLTFSNKLAPLLNFGPESSTLKILPHATYKAAVYSVKRAHNHGSLTSACSVASSFLLNPLPVLFRKNSSVYMETKINISNTANVKKTSN